MVDERTTVGKDRAGETQGFWAGPDDSAPPLDGSVWPVVLFLRDVIWVCLLSIPILFNTFLDKFRGKEEKELTGQVVVVTGAGNGLGKEMARQFAAHGSRVACVDIRAEDSEATAVDIRATGAEARAYRCDVSKPEEAKSLADEVQKDFGPVDILVNNAGIIFGHALDKGSDEDIKLVLNVNLLSHFWMIRAFLPAMKQRRRGQIVFLNSASALVPLANASSYTASKFGLLGLAHSLDDELRQNPEYNDIKLTSVLPYFIKTHAKYEALWRVRVPAMEVEDTAREVIKGIRREYFTFTVPGISFLYSFMFAMRLVPIEVFRLIKKTLYTQILVNEDGTTLRNKEIHKTKIN